MRSCILIAFLSLGSMLAQAGDGGSGVRGGGHVIEVNGRLELVDIVTNATCEWKSGSDLMAENPYIASILSKVSVLDWYFALELEREIRFLSWCFTGPLYYVSPVDNDSFVVQLEDGVQQAAFRYGPAAYIDGGNYFPLSQRSQSLLVFHETLHSYLDMDEPMRRFWLMSTVATLGRVDAGQITSRAQLHLNLRNNHIQFPLTVGHLDPYKEKLKFLLQDLPGRIAILMQEESPEWYLNLDPNDVLSNLAEWDRESIANPSQILSQTIIAAITGGSTEDARKVLYDQHYSRLNPAGLALDSFIELSSEKQTLVEESPYFARIQEDALAFFSSATVSIAEGRVVASAALQAIGGDPVRSNAITLSSLRGWTIRDEIELSPELQASATLLAHLVREGNWARVEELYTSNPAFYSAFDLTAQEKQLAGLNVPIARERTLCAEVLREISEGLYDHFLHSVRSKVGDELYAGLASRIHRGVR